jgi:hypothetical protein
MAITGRRVTVTDEPTRLSTNPTDAGHPGSAVLVKNPAGSGGDIDIGGATVASGAGYLLAEGDPPLAWQLERPEAVYGIAADGETVVVHVAEEGV